jgi:hypothetical protein
MIKTHKTTGLKYLCKLSTDNREKCFKYKGSGVYWKRHLKIHRPNITTEIIEECDDIHKLHERGLYWSEFYNVVKSEDWANLIPEDGGLCFFESRDKRKNQLELLRQTDEYKKQRISCGHQTRVRQLNKTMKERIGYDYHDPRIGKKWNEIYKEGITHAQVKPFKIILNNNEREWKFLCESQIFSKIGLYPYPLLKTLKKGDVFTIKNVSKRARHKFKKGDQLKLIFIDKSEL